MSQVTLMQTHNLEQMRKDEQNRHRKSPGNTFPVTGRAGGHTGDWGQCQARILNPAALTLAAQSLFVGGLPCALWEVQQHPWPPPRRCQESLSPAVTTENVSTYCQMSPGRQNHHASHEKVVMLDAIWPHRCSPIKFYLFIVLLLRTMEKGDLSVVIPLDHQE